LAEVTNSRSMVLACVLRATTKNGRQLFRGKKVHPSEKILAKPMNKKQNSR